MPHPTGVRFARLVVPLSVALAGALGAACGHDKPQNAGPAVRVWDGGTIALPTLIIDSANPEQGIVGRMTMAGTDVTFSSKHDPQSGNTVARMRAGEEGEVVVTVSSSNTATMAVGGQEISGHGAPTPAEQAALAAMGASAIGPSLAMLPMEIGCRMDSAATEKERAALLVPWQMLIKYDATFPSPEVFERIASCRYFEPTEQAPGSIDAGTAPPRGRGIRLANDDRVPNVFGIFPFDGEGAVVPTSQFGHNTRPCTALCFGTCGPDCDATACTSTYEWYCLKGAGNANTGWKRVRRHWNCGSHQGCRDHDACYDNCNESNGCNTWGATMCRRTCDTLCLNDHGVGNCTSWMNGGGPFDARRDYYHDLGVPDEQDATLCPTPVDGGVDGGTGGGGGGMSGGGGSTGAGGMSASGGVNGDGGIATGGISGSGGATGKGGSGGSSPGTGGTVGTGAVGGFGAFPGTGGMVGTGGVGGTGAFPGTGGTVGTGGVGGTGAFPGTGGTVGTGGVGGFGAFPGTGGTVGTGGVGGYGAFPGSGGIIGTGGVGGYGGFSGGGSGGI